ncbi:FAD-binding oxidoreductase [uncultured Hydrogenophaga sp.]|uniref:FAD-binding oxidoreductase n=1 Tax=uncultured Hydrogenophaga sp. TaxID=199683 RepID=UPI0025849182|nr:FAD-binding oxidoreductase [uncultured Hydrogenophaga sp.]
MTHHYKFWGWGLADEVVPEKEGAEFTGWIAQLIKHQGGLDAPTPAPTVDEIQLRAPRLDVPSDLTAICSTTAEDRLIHHYGKSYFDAARCFERQFDNPPDVVARPRNEQELIQVMAWAERVGAALIPYGAGSSVVAGIEGRNCEGFNGVITLNTQALDQVLEIDPVSRAARVQAGILGPALESALQPHGLTLRHFPQSFQYSTLGGWIACRAAGHYATRLTHIDDVTQAVRMVTPRGVAETRRLPSSGSGPAPDRLWLGSEGTLGIITEAWMRLQGRPDFRDGATVYFDDYFKGAQAVRAILQAGYAPANCRLISAQEAQSQRAANGSKHLLVLGFESSHGPVDRDLAAALEIAASFGGSTTAGAEAGGDSNSWRRAFLRLPYYREVLTSYGFMLDTFASAITWERFEAFHHAVKADTEKAILEVTGQPGLVTTRFSHAYVDGPAPYFTFFAKGTPGQLSRQWREIRHAALDSVIRHGGPATHHQAIGRDHRPFYDKERPEATAQILRAAKSALDPSGMLNPGVLIDAQKPH